MATAASKRLKKAWTSVQQLSDTEWKEWHVRTGPVVPDDGRMQLTWKPGPTALNTAMTVFSKYPSATMQTVEGCINGELVAHCTVVLYVHDKGGAAHPPVASISNLQTKHTSCEYGMLLMHAVKTSLYERDDRSPGQTVGKKRKGSAPKIHVVVPVSSTHDCIFWAANGFKIDAAARKDPSPAAAGVGMTFDFVNSHNNTRQ